MLEPDLIKIFTGKLNELNVPYIITGSIASIIYGEPRLTHDIDIVIHLPANYVYKFRKIFPEKRYYVPPEEVLISEAKKENRGHCNIIHHETGFKADIYFAGNNDFQLWAIRNAKTIEYAGDKIFVAPVEYVIINKLQYFKEGKSQKHIDDVRAILKNSKEIIDDELLGKYIDKFKLEDEWRLCNN